MTEQDIELAAKWVDHLLLEHMLIQGDKKRELRTQFVEGLRSGLEPPTHIDILATKTPDEVVAILSKAIKEQKEENEHPSTFRYPRLTSKD